MKFILTATDVTQEIHKEFGASDCFSDMPAMIELNSLDELVAFADRWGSIIVSVYGEFPRIEIYNDYRE